MYFKLIYININRLVCRYLDLKHIELIVCHTKCFQNYQSRYVSIFQDLRRKFIEKRSIMRNECKDETTRRTQSAWFAVKVKYEKLGNKRVLKN